MKPEENKAILSICDSTRKTLSLTFASIGDPRSLAISKSLEPIVETAPCLECVYKTDREQEEPYIQIHDNIRFKCRLDDKLLQLFVDALALILKNPYLTDCQIDFDLQTPVFLKLFIAPFCPYCPNVALEMIKLALTYEKIKLEVIDGTLFSEKAKKDSIVSAPTLICDNTIRWNGQVTSREVLDVLMQRKPSELSSDSFKAMIESGNAQELAQMMVEAQQIFPSFYELLVHEKWPVRLGAMVVAETIGEISPLLTRDLLDRAWDMFEQAPESVQGDIIYLTGEIGGQTDCQRLMNLNRESCSDEILEIIDEAINTLNSQ